MSTPTVEQLTAALATVHDPEIKRPITELGMVDHLEVDDAGRVVGHRAADGLRLPAQGHHRPRRTPCAQRRRRRHRGRAHPRCDDRRAARPSCQTNLRGGKPPKEIPFAQPGSLTKVFAIASGKGGVGKSSVTVNLALAMAKAGPDGRHRRRRHLRPLRPRDARHRRLTGPPRSSTMIMPVPTPSGVSVISIGMLKPRRDQVVAWRGPMLDRALVQMLADVYWGDLDVLLLDLPPGTGDMAHLARPAPPERRDPGRHHPAGGGRRGRRARRDDGLDAPPARGRRRREHELPGLPALRPVPPARAVREWRRRARGRDPLAAASGTTYRCSGGSRSRRPCARAATPGKPVVDSDPTSDSAQVLDRGGRPAGLARTRSGRTPAGPVSDRRF